MPHSFSPPGHRSALAPACTLLPLAFCLPCHVQESLSALFSIPLEIAAQLVGKHPALATTPPNATITKAKTMSLALGCTMQVITAKATVQV